MSTGCLIGEQVGANALENENILIVDYWLDYVAATDERGQTRGGSLHEKGLGSMFERFERRTKVMLDDRFSRRQTTEELCSALPANSAKSLPAWTAGRWFREPGKNNETSLLARGKRCLADRLRKCALFDLFSKRT